MGMTRELDNSTQMTIHLATEATAEDKENVQKTIYKTKSAESFDEKLKALSGSLKADLALTYAFLLDSNLEDPRVAKLTQPGLQKMIAVRLTQLMPQRCFPCRDRLFYYKRGESPVVECRRCKRGACGECYGQEDVRQMTKFRFLCRECDDIVHEDMGEGRLLSSDFDKAWAKKNPEKNPGKEKEQPEKEAPKTKEKEATLEEPVDRPSQKDLFDETVEEIESSESEPEDEEAILQRQKNKKLLEKKSDEKKVKQKERRNNDTKSKKKETVCPHLMKGRCHYGLSGRKHNKNKPDHDESQCRKEKMCECPFSHPLVCGKLLRNGAGRNGCKEESQCNKLHPKICPYSSKGVCHQVGCQLGIHIQGTNTKETRENDKKEKDGGRRGLGRAGAAGASHAPQDPGLPAPGQPQALPQVLGRQQRRDAVPASTPAPTPAPHPGQGLAGLNQETASFLGQLLLGELLRRVQQEAMPAPRMESRQEPKQETPKQETPKQEAPSFSLEALLRSLTLQQHN